MGPDCGTAIVSGVALGFANVVRPGPVGLVAASGTGAQQVSCLLDTAGVGVSHVLGVGGRDLSEAVGGLATLDALAALDADPATERVLLVSKPPGAVGRRHPSTAAAAELSVPVRSAVLSAETPDLTAAVEALLRDMGLDVPTWPSRPGPAASAVPGATLKGLYSGGTLADEAMLLAAPALGDIRSNTPLKPELALGTDLSATGHVVIDFGDDALTVGRAHPMIDPTLRLEAIAAWPPAGEPAVLLLDVVLGYGADPDPGRRARAGADRRPRGRRVPLPVVVALIGTEADPQGWSRQADALAAAGAAVFASNAAATRYALDLLGASRMTEPLGGLLDRAAGRRRRRRRRLLRRAARPGRRGARRRLAPAGLRRRRPTSPRSPSTRAGPRPTGRRSSGSSPPARSWSTSGPAREVHRPAPTGCCCTPARR